MSEIRFQEKEYNTDSLDAGLWKKIINLLGNQKKDLYWLFVFMLLVAVLDVVFPYLNKIAIDYFAIGKGTQGQLIGYGVGYLLLLAVQAFFVFKFIAQSGIVETDFSYYVRKTVFDKLQVLSYSYYDKTPTGWIMARMTSDVGRLAEIIAWSLVDMVWGLTVMVGITIVMLIVNWKMALLVLVVVPILAYISVWFQTRILKNYRLVRQVNSKITSSFSEGIAGAKTTKTMVLEEQNLEEFNRLTSEMREKAIRAAILSSLFMPIVIGLSAVSTGAILWYGGNQVLFYGLEFGTLMMFTQYANQFFEPLRQIARLLAELQMAQASAERVLSLLEEEPAIVDSDEVIAQYGTILEPKVENYPVMKGDISFEHVDFNYLPEEPVLVDFNLEVQAGQTIALVGETGSGKSTIVNLLCRFYEPVKGIVKIDGVDYKQRSLGWLHSNLGYVLQAPHLFSGTVKENIQYGRMDASMEEIIDAAKLVNAHEFIMKLEKGYDTDVGEGGGRLSTGEKQLICFARAVLADPKLFILDEATASIDTETEKVIQDAIDKVLVNRTSFVVAHRLSTIVNADVILVMKNGRILEKGNHDALMKLKGYYYRLYTNQFNENLQKELLKQK
ncbi:MAG: ABC transporter ATP-binding protein [Erysipelotrichaceae bacterium]|nr:ABC transporter ATP-binding protein [Erysipelotrichaceae bacterium]